MLFAPCFITTPTWMRCSPAAAASSSAAKNSHNLIAHCSAQIFQCRHQLGGVSVFFGGHRYLNCIFIATDCYACIDCKLINIVTIRHTEDHHFRGRCRLSHHCLMKKAQRVMHVFVLPRRHSCCLQCRNLMMMTMKKKKITRT
jgi:hypothetical protein